MTKKNLNLSKIVSHNNKIIVLNLCTPQYHKILEFFLILEAITWGPIIGKVRLFSSVGKTD